MKYSDISKARRDIEICCQKGSSDAYWAAHSTFNHLLLQAVIDDDLMRELTKQQLLRVIKWCSSYRPMEPHALLTILGQLVDH